MYLFLQIFLLFPSWKLNQLHACRDNSGKELTKILKFKENKCLVIHNFSCMFQDHASLTGINGIEFSPLRSRVLRESASVLS